MLAHVEKSKFVILLLNQESNVVVKRVLTVYYENVSLGILRIIVNNLMSVKCQKNIINYSSVDCLKR